MPSHPHQDKPLSDVPDEVWSVARAREQVIRKLVEKPPVRGTRSEVMAAAAAELGITLQYLYRLLKAYEADPRTRSLLPKLPGPRTGVRRLDPRLETIIEEEIRTQYLGLLKPKKAALMKG